MNSVAGLQTALNLVGSQGVNDRTSGLNSLVEIFSYPDNLEKFHQSAHRRDGDGWVALFQCLFEAVVRDKDAALKSKATASAKAKAQGRLERTAASVRQITELSVLRLSEQPFIALFNHMSSLMVKDKRLFEPVALDYIKALRALLRHPPHLQRLPAEDWRTLMSICWSALLGEPIVADDEWQDGSLHLLDATQPGKYGLASSSVAKELISLILSLLQSPSAPLVARPRAVREDSDVLPALGLPILLKIHRYLSLCLAGQGSIHLEILQCLNIVLGELELNSTNDFTEASLHLFPVLVDVWLSRSKADPELREHLLVALRMMMPFITNPSIADQDTKELVQSWLGRILSGIPKETSSRGGIRPLDLDCLRLLSSRAAHERGPFELSGVMPGFGFDLSQAMSWVSIELFATCCFHTYNSYTSISATAAPSTPAAPPTATQFATQVPTQSQWAGTQKNGRPAKRQRNESSIDKLLRLVSSQTRHIRLLALQTIVFLVDMFWTSIESNAQDVIRTNLLDLLDDDDNVVQSWVFVGLSALAVLDEKRTANVDAQVLRTPGARTKRNRDEQLDWERVWAHATRKATVAPLSRSACHTTEAILKSDKVDHSRCVRDMHALLRNADIQGPPIPWETTCSLFVCGLATVRADVGLYSANLEDKILDWFGRSYSADGTSRATAARINPGTPATYLKLLGAICNFRDTDIVDVTVLEQLPDCPIVDHILEEAKTRHIRQLILRGEIPRLSHNKESSATSSPCDPPLSVESLAFLDGRPRKLSDMLKFNLDKASTEWSQSDHLVTPERLRRTIDLVTLTLAFQASIHANGLRPDVVGCLASVVTVLGHICTHLSTSSANINFQLLIWRGFMPLYAVPRPPPPAIWPILLESDSASGVRKDILPRGHSLQSQPPIMKASRDSITKLLTIVWTRQETREALTEVVHAAKSTLGKVVAHEHGGGSLEAVAADDDDFQIQQPATNAVTQPSDAKVAAQHSTDILVQTLISLRLRSAQLASTSHRPTVDSGLINLFLEAEGSRFKRLGYGICEAIREGSLGLTIQAATYLLDELQHRLRSYAYQRDGELISLTVTFMARLCPIWLAPESGMSDEVITMAKRFVLAAEEQQIASWQGRLAVVVFIDTYLEYDPSCAAWHDMSDTEEADLVMGGTSSTTWGPLLHLLNATADVDARVRFRAASSATQIHHLTDVSPALKDRAYFDIIKRRSKVHAPLNFLSDLIWKLNTCLASGTLRADTLFHLYEIADHASAWLVHLQSGLEAVAERLGLDSLKQLYKVHSGHIVLSQLGSHQMPLTLPPSISGCATRKEFAQLCLETVGSQVLAEHDSTNNNFGFFSDLCDAASVPLDQALERSFPLAAALTIVYAVDQVPTAKMNQAVAQRLDGLPIPNSSRIDALMAANVELIMSNLFILVDLSESNAAVAKVLNSQDAEAQVGDVFSRLLEHDTVVYNSPEVITPSAPAGCVLHAHAFLRDQNAKKMSKRRLVFDSLVRLFHSVNDTYLVLEQRRFLRSIAAVVSLYAAELRHPVILQLFLRNVIDLLHKPDIAFVILSFVQWGFDQLMIRQVAISADALEGLMVSIGSAYVKMTNEGLVREAEGFATWVSSRATVWQKHEAICKALEVALVFWPPRLANGFDGIPQPHLLDLIAITEKGNISDPMALCKRIASSVDANTSEEDKTHFVSSTFWFLKRALTPVLWTQEGAMAFLDLLYVVNGDIHSPSLQAIAGLTGHTHLLEESKRFSKDPEGALRVAMLEKLLEQTATDDYQRRQVAYTGLQMALPMAKSNPVSVPSHLRDVLSYMIPVSPLALPSDSNLDDLSDERAGWVVKSSNHQLWSKDLASMLAALASQDDPIYLCLRPLLAIASNACKEVLPYLVQAVLTCGADRHEGETIQRAKALSQHFTQVLQYPFASTETVEMIIQIVLHLRHFKPSYSTDPLSYNHWLTIDPLILSEASGRYGAYASSLLFLEMAKDQADQEDTEFSLSSTRVQKVMYDIYSNVEDPDGFYGIQNNDAMDSLLRRLDHEGQPLRALGYNLAGFEATQTPFSGSQTELASLRNLHDLGFNGLAGTVMRSAKGNSSQTKTDPFLLEVAWRMGDWDVPVTNDFSGTSTGRFYSALRAVHREREQPAAERVVSTMINSEMKALQEIGIERMTEIKQSTASLLCLHDVAHWLSPRIQTTINQGDFEGNTLKQFLSLDPSMEFSNAERLSATRLSLIRSARQRESNNLFGDLASAQSDGLTKMEICSQLLLSKHARKDGNLQASVNAVMAVRQLEDGETPSDAGQDEFGQVLWAQGEHSLAIQHLVGMLSTVDARDSNAKTRQALLRGRLAHWTSLAKLKSAEEIRSTFRKAMDDISKTRASDQERAQLAYDFALFTDRYYQTLSKSPERERLKSFVDRRYDQIQRIRASRSSTPGSRRQTLDRDQLEIEEDLKAKEDQDRELLRYLTYCLTSYAAALRVSDEFDDSITRLCSIWLDHDSNEEANVAFAPYLKDIPSHKFIFLGPQLAARLHRPKTPTAFNSSLNSLMLRLSQDHPYHTLYQVIPLAHGVRLPATSKSKAAAESSIEGRGGAAAEIMERLNSESTRALARNAAHLMTSFHNAAVAWCNYDHDKKSGERVRPGTEKSLPSDSSLRRCTRLHIPVATVIPAVDLTLAYESVPTIERYRETFKLAGGLHHPAIMTCIDSVGQEHVQLFKGDDEVRQDAVMEQVFEMTNRLLQRDRLAKARNLHFRTYTVIPLANRTGIIQFVGNTIGIGDWLKDAHVRYRKGIDISPDIFRKNIAKSQEKDWSNPKIVDLWTQQMEKFKPVMRHFFTEKHREPLAWFTMRVNYARSVAVTSIVGWMVGLGDRHCSNILLDKGTGEFVQIDFGIAFEEGRKLRIPEKVPFRLTNDVVDGLGMTGVDGTFRQCSEHTLRVLRESSELILTVLEVFKHDPLYAWSGDPNKMKRAGGGRTDSNQQSTSGQDKAERVLARISQKLGTQLGVEYTVNQLIQEARDPRHLAMIFVGWQSWL